MACVDRILPHSSVYRVTCSLIGQWSVIVLWGPHTHYLLWNPSRLEKAPALGGSQPGLSSEDCPASVPTQGRRCCAVVTEFGAALSWSKHFCGTPEEKAPGRSHSRGVSPGHEAQASLVFWQVEPGYSPQSAPDLA